MREKAPMFSDFSLDSFVQTVASHELFLLCDDPLRLRDFPFMNELLGVKGVTPYLAKTRGVTALQIKQGRKSGFLIPGRTWKWEGLVNAELVRNLGTIFKITGLQATTPAALSEKVFRSTLPEKLHLPRPAIRLRDDILQNNVGGRIDLAERNMQGAYSRYELAYEFDKSKAYLHHSREVPDPFLAPVICVNPSIEEAMEYPTGWWQCEMIAHGKGYPPIQIEGRKPVDGECFIRWLWSGELQDCRNHGYTLCSIQRGYGFRQMSNFMQPWADICYQLYYQSRDESEHLRDIIKSMMVGLPGRFLRTPELLTLIHESAKQPGDIPLPLKREEDGDPFFSDWVMRPEYDPKNTSLAPIGSYIVAQMRRELYHECKRIEGLGGKIIRTYIDCIATDIDGFGLEQLGQELGKWKRKMFWNVYAEENRFIGRLEGEGLADMRAPGLSKLPMSLGFEQRMAMWRRYNENTRGV